MDNAKNNIKILVVDDQESWRVLLNAVLKGEGYEVTTAANFQDGSDYIKIGGFDLIILDLRLVDNATYNIQGMALLKQTKLEHPNTRAVLFTGFPDEMQKDRAINIYGADEFLEKVPDGMPLDIDKFLEIIRRLTGNR
jgi:DNA-binding NtrC family response regulator